MMTQIRNGCIAMFFVAVQLAVPARAEFQVFGDSLSETGNFSILSGGSVPPAALYSGGRFSNGTTWVEHLALALGEPLPEPFLAGGTNYAFNGARAAGVSPYETPDLAGQVSTFLQANGGVADAEDVYVIWAGANDIFFGATAGELNFIPEAIDGISQAVQNLYAAGARNFVIADLPALGLTPFFNSSPEIAGLLNSATTAFNGLLRDEVAMLNFELIEVRIAEVPVNRLFLLVTRFPILFGFTNTKDSATLYNPVTGIGYARKPGANPNRYLFWDSVHPTARAHKSISAVAFLSILLCE